MTEASSSSHCVQLGDEQYKFGVGPIVVRDAVVESSILDGGETWYLVGAQVATGTVDRHGEWLPRQIYVPTNVVNILRRAGQVSVRRPA